MRGSIANRAEDLPNKLLRILLSAYITIVYVNEKFDCSFCRKGESKTTNLEMLSIDLQRYFSTCFFIEYG